MKFLERIKNIWKLSEFEPHKPTEENKVPGTIVSMIMKRPAKAQFLPFTKKTPIEQINEVANKEI